MRFFLDHGVPVSVARVLREAGHEAIIQKDAIAADSPDTLVALTAAQNEAILICYDKDFKAIASRFSVSNTRFRKLSRIQFKCKEPEAAKRIIESLDFIEFEWKQAKKRHDSRIFIEVQGAALKTQR